MVRVVPVAPILVNEEGCCCLDVDTLFRGESGVDPWLSADSVVVVMVGDGIGGAIIDLDSAQMPNLGELVKGATPESPPGRGGRDPWKCGSLSDKSVVLRELGGADDP